MRMWMVDPKILCRQHLLGEHRELHMLLGTLKKKRSIKGYLARNIMQPTHIRYRHDKLVDEMKRRGYSHNSPLLIKDGTIEYLKEGKYVTVNVNESYKELFKRCKRCRHRILMYKRIYSK